MLAGEQETNDPAAEEAIIPLDGDDEALSPLKATPAPRKRTNKPKGSATTSGGRASDPNVTTKRVQRSADDPPVIDLTNFSDVVGKIGEYQSMKLKTIAH